MPFEKSNPAWQFQQFSQRIGEWIEARWNRIQASPSSGDWPKFPSVSQSLWEGLFWLIVVGAVAWVLWKLTPIVERYWMQQQGDRLPVAPSAPVRSKSEWLQLAQRYQQQQNYSQACRALYIAVLHHLNDRGLLSIDQSRTNGEYLRFIQTLPRPHPYQVLLNAHDQVYYGDRPASAETFNQCQRAYQEITATPDQASSQH